MATELLMPKLGLTMQEGTITSWVVPSGTTVSAGTVVMTIETDKVEAEVEAEADGVLTHVAAAGDTVECGIVVGYLLAEGESTPAEAPAPPVGRILASPKARRIAAERSIDLAQVRGTGPGGRITSEDLAEVVPKRIPGGTGAGSRFVPHVARTAAARLGIDIGSVVGTGPGGRVTRADVYAASVAAPPADRSRATPAALPGGEHVALTGMRAVIAERMSSSLADSAQLTLFMDVNMNRVQEFRDQRQAVASDGSDTVAGYTDFVVAAVARALRQHPFVNSSIVGDEIVLHEEINVGLAVAVDDGLVVPVVRRADSLSLADLAVETSRLAAAARDRSLALTEIEGATMTVTALGMFGVDGFTPIIQQPNTAILGVGRIRDETYWEDDRPRRTSVLTLSLTWDHRAFDGAPAARFAAAIKEGLEDPSAFFT